jgi:hypothetical protein
VNAIALALPRRWQAMALVPVVSPFSTSCMVGTCVLHRLLAAVGCVRHRVPAQPVRRDAAGFDLELVALGPEPDDQRHGNDHVLPIARLLVTLPLSVRRGEHA